MDREFALQIIERYSQVVDETAQMVSGVPESRLPCDPSFVKEAIKLILTETPEGSNEYHHLRSIYPKLASFIPDKEAEMSAKAEEAMMSMDVSSEGFKHLNEHGEILKRIQNNTYLLTQEIREHLDGMTR